MLKGTVQRGSTVKGVGETLSEKWVKKGRKSRERELLLKREGWRSDLHSRQRKGSVAETISKK